MILYLSMAALLIAAAALATRPWWRRGADARVQRRAANVAAYRTRVAEIETDLGNGLIDAESAQELKQELGARLLADADAGADVSTPTAAGKGRGLALIALALLGAFAALMYYRGDSWRTREMIELAQRDPAQAQALMVQSMVSKLAARLQQNPDDAEGWAMLGRS
ncbi:MAG TPA: c-type cytochrome biogenesis protein CcmI, partial [Nevskiaceae bacterium]|nr:c-type cytochrome biogenesis protein CcmI [Nevskiaceae bacterium]